MWGLKLWGSHGSAEVSENGEVLTRAYEYSEPFIQVLTDTTVKSFVGPLSGQQFIMTGMYATADRSITAAGDVLEIYEATAADSGTQAKLLFSTDLARQGESAPVVPAAKVAQGHYVNADRTNSAGNITVTIWGYFIPITTS